MRAILSKIVAGSMIAAAALTVSACSSNDSATNVTNTTEVVPTENVGATDTMVTNIDAAAPTDNGAMMDTNSTSTTDMGGNTTGTTGAEGGNAM